MKKTSSILVMCIVLTVLMIVWTILLPLWAIEWTIENWLLRMWFNFDILLCALLVSLSYFIYKKSRIVKFFSPMLFGMTLADLTINLLMLIYSGNFNFYSIKGALTLCFTFIVLVTLFLFYEKVQKESLAW
jgi:hypothetical protein